MLKNILILLIFTNSILLASNIMTVKQYKFINDTSPSIQDGIRNYHKKVASKKMYDSGLKGMFYFKSIDDGSEEGEYNTLYETIDKNEASTMGTYKMQFGFGAENGGAWIGRQIGTDNLVVNAQTLDHSFVFNRQIFTDGLNVLLGINLHSEPKYIESDGKLYFSNKNTSTTQFVWNVIYYDLDLGVFYTDKSQSMVTAYSFKTDFGEFIPQFHTFVKPYKYKDYKLTYINEFEFDYYKFGMNIWAKKRHLSKENNTIEEGLITSFALVEQTFMRVLKISIGYSKTKEFTQENLSGYSLKIAFFGDEILRYLMSKNSNRTKLLTSNDTSMEVYFGVSNNYYEDIQDTFLINQDLALFGVNWNW